MIWHKLLCFMNIHQDESRFKPVQNDIWSVWICTQCGRETHWEPVIINANPKILQLVKQHQHEDGAWIKNARKELGS
jgi:hypothetical protein